MLKKTTLSAVLAIVAVLALPALASANWTTEGAPLNSNASALLKGSFSWEGDLGSVTCFSGATAGVELNAGTTDATVASFVVDNPSKCFVEGFVGTICGGASLTNVHLAHNATAVVSGTSTLSLSNVELAYDFGTCTTITLTDLTGVTLTADNHTDVHSVSVNGALEDNIGGEEEVFGTLEVSPSGMYGF